jgi:hypothetical protein
MTTEKLGAIAFTLFALLACSAFAQESAPQLLDFKNTDFKVRMNAYQAVKGNQDMLQRADVRDGLVGLLDRENHVIEATLVPETSPSADAKYGEAYAEYVSDLLNTVAQIVDWSSERQVCVLAQSSYSPGSAFARVLAVKGGAKATPCLLEMAKGNRYDREQATPTLVQIAAVTKSLSSTVRSQIRQATIAGLRDTDLSTRQETVRAVGEFGGLDFIPTLEDIARSDPYSRPINEGRNRRYDVREEAAKAIKSIQERAKAK